MQQQSITQMYGLMLFNVVVAILVLCLIYGIFGAVFANPSGTVDFSKPWLKLVIGFWTQVLNAH